MTKERLLHEIIAVENDLSNAAKDKIAEATHTFGHKGHLFTGHTKRVEFFDGDRQPENTTETKKVGETVPSKLAYLFGFTERLYDLLATKEATNQEAVADLIVDGETLETKLPVGFLVGLESRLTALREALEAIPTLQPGLDWQPDPKQGGHIYTAQSPDKFKTEANIKAFELSPATKEHRAQVEKITEQKAVARIFETNYSGMLTPAQKSAILARMEKLLIAVKQARRRANSTPIVERKPGKLLMDYLLGDLKA